MAQAEPRPSLRRLLMTTSAYYDHIADSTDPGILLMPVRQFVEGSVGAAYARRCRGQRVLDLACTGFLFADLQAGRGGQGDRRRPLKREMLRAAKRSKKATNGITFRQGDATKLPDLGTFDVLAVYLLHYAPSLDALKAMCQASPATSSPGSLGSRSCSIPNIAPDPTYYRVWAGPPRRPEVRTDGRALQATLHPDRRLGAARLTVHRWEQATIEARCATPV